MIYGNILKTGMGIKTLHCGLIALLIPIVVTIMARFVKKQSVRRTMASALLLLYAGGIIWLTVGGRASEESQVNLTPFWSYTLFADPQYRWQIYLNIFLFVPFGFLLPLAARRGFWSTVLIGMLFSMGIEAAQYFFRLGFCEFDDVFHNTVGTALGYGYGRVLCFLERKLEKPIELLIGRCREALDARNKSEMARIKDNTTNVQQTELTEEQQSFLHCLRSALFTGESFQLSDAVIAEARQQAVLSLISKNVEVYQIIAQNVEIAYEQREAGKALSSIPYVVLKGLAAAIYYPEPLRRALGDIDIIVRPEDFPAAYHALESHGYVTKDPLDGADRHVHFKKNWITIELHRTYASLNKRAQEELLDAWIYDGIPKATNVWVQDQQFPVLPAPLNGLTLLAHISQHLEDGLGIRQIIDWVMYVDKRLRDDAWPEFRKLTDQLGLTKLAMAAARLGQLYLGLSDSILWCRDMDDQVCADLLQYVMDCANFGTKAPTSNTVTMVLSHSKGVAGLFRNLQTRGESNWKALKKHPGLKPFAWIYQGFRYAAKGLKRDRAFSEFGKDLAASKRRNRLMEALGARQLAKRNRNG